MQINSSPSTIISDWFGDDFSSLHPLLQDLHTYGGILEGQAHLTIGHHYLSRYFGRLLAKKLGTPEQTGDYVLTVNIYHQDNLLHWDKTFNHTQNLISIFKPIGIKDNGFFLEENGPFKMRLSVDIRNGAWVWKVIEFYLGHRKIPKFFFPRSFARKYINQNNEYVFHVSFSFLGIGEIFSYHGILKKIG